MNIKDFKVGQEVYILDYGNRISLEKAVIKKRTVTDIGRKYVTVDNSLKFYIENDSDNYLSLYYSGYTTYDKLFVSEQDISDYKEKLDLIQVVLKMTTSVNLDMLSLDNLKEIVLLLTPEKQ